MPDYNMVKTYRDIYHSNETFQEACWAAWHTRSATEKDDVDLVVFIEQEAMYQQLEATYYPCRSNLNG